MYSDDTVSRIVLVLTANVCFAMIVVDRLQIVNICNGNECLQETLRNDYIDTLR